MTQITTFREFRTEAMRTLKVLAPDLHFVHVMTGMCTEVGEMLDPIKKHIAYDRDLDWVNVKEESGDWWWYVGVAIPEDKIDEVTDSINHYLEVPMDNWCSVLDEYRKPDGAIIEVGLAAEPTKIQNMIFASRLYGWTLPEIWTMVIEKLRERYPECFTEELALNRDLDNERQILEKHA